MSRLIDVQENTFIQFNKKIFYVYKNDGVAVWVLPNPENSDIGLAFDSQVKVCSTVKIKKTWIKKARYELKRSINTYALNNLKYLETLNLFNDIKEYK